MGMRFRKSIGIGKGARLNIGKGSVGLSVGAKGARYSVNSRRGVTTSVGAPGTGISYSSTSGGGGGRSGGGSSGGGSGAAIGLLALVILYVLVFGGGYLLLRGVQAEREAEPDWFDTSTSVGDSATAAAGNNTTVIVTPGGQTTPIDVIADGVETYLAGKGCPVTSTRKVSDHSRVECVVTVPGVSDTDGSVKPSNWADLQTALIGLAAGAQSAVPDQGDYTVFVRVQSAKEDNLLVASDSKILYDKFQAAADKAAAAEKMVYASASGSKYHSKPDCGNMTSATRITISEAQSRGLTACSRCW